MEGCYLEIFADARQNGHKRCQVIQTETGRILYVTWPYRTPQSALRRAERWLSEERDKPGRGPYLLEKPLFAL